MGRRYVSHRARSDHALSTRGDRTAVEPHGRNVEVVRVGTSNDRVRAYEIAATWRQEGLVVKGRFVPFALADCANPIRLIPVVPSVSKKLPESLNPTTALLPHHAVEVSL